MPFYERFHGPIRRREKRFSLRNERYGEPGDVISSDAGPIRILSVRRETPAWVRDNLYQEEGCASPADFSAVWLRIHPRAPKWDHLRWLHEFEPVTPDDGGDA